MVRTELAETIFAFDLGASQPTELDFRFNDVNLFVGLVVSRSVLGFRMNGIERLPSQYSECTSCSGSGHLIEMSRLRGGGMTTQAYRR